MSAESTVVVSGAGTGIGRAVASQLAADGFQVTAVGRRKEPLELLAGELGQRVYTVTADVATDTGAAEVAANVASAGSRAQESWPLRAGCQRAMCRATGWTRSAANGRHRSSRTY